MLISLRPVSPCQNGDTTTQPSQQDVRILRMSNWVFCFISICICIISLTYSKGKICLGWLNTWNKGASATMTPASTLRSSQWIQNWFLSLRRESWLALESLPVSFQSQRVIKVTTIFILWERTHHEDCNPCGPSSSPSRNTRRISPGPYLSDNMKVKSLDRVSINLFSGEISWRHHFPPEGSVPRIRHSVWDHQIRAVRCQRDPSCMRVTLRIVTV